MCGKRLNRTWWVLLLLLLPLSPSSSDDAETVRQTLNECVTRLEITTNELESVKDLLIESKTLISQQQTLIQTQRFLNSDLMTQLTARDTRLQTIGDSLNEYAENRRKDITIATIKGLGIGIGVSSIIYTVLSLIM